MNSDHYRQHERFNLDNYRHPSQRRQSRSSSNVILSQQHISSNAPIAHPVAPAPAPPSKPKPIVHPFRSNIDGHLRAFGSSRDVHSNLAPIPTDVLMSPLPRSSGSGSTWNGPSMTSPYHSTNINPFAFGAVKSGLYTLPAGEAAPATLPPPVPPPAPPLVPTLAALENAAIIPKLLERMDLLAARQESVFKVFGTLITQLSNSVLQRDHEDTNNATIVENTKSTAKAMGILAERIESLTEGVTVIQQVLGIPAASIKQEATAAARHIKNHRLSNVAAVQAKGVLAGKSPSNAIDVDGLDETSGLGDAGYEKVAVAQRTIIDRLDSMEIDFAEFMERVRDPDANVDELLGRSSAVQHRKRDVGISPRTPSPPPALPPDAIPPRHESRLTPVDEPHQGIESMDVVTPKNKPMSVTESHNDAKVLNVSSSALQLSQPTNISTPTLSDKMAFDTFLENIKKDIIVLTDSGSAEEAQSDNVSSLPRRRSISVVDKLAKNDNAPSVPSPGMRAELKSRGTPLPLSRSPSIQTYPAAEASLPVKSGDHDDHRPFKRLRRWSSSSRPTPTKSTHKEPGTGTSIGTKSVNMQDLLSIFDGPSKSETPGASERGKSKTVWVTRPQPSGNTFRDLREVKFGPPKKFKPMKITLSKDSRAEASSRISSATTTTITTTGSTRRKHSKVPSLPADHTASTASETNSRLDSPARDSYVHRPKKKRPRPTESMEGESAIPWQSSQCSVREALQGSLSAKRAEGHPRARQKERPKEKS